MPRKKKEKPKTREEEDINLAEIGDYCYFLSVNNKAVFAEVLKVTEENGYKVLQLMDQTEGKYVNVVTEICSFDDKKLKGKKRHELCPEVYKKR